MVGVRLADDRRARVPFALLGVLLLVGSMTVAGAFTDRGSIREDHTVDDAMDRTTASATSALRTAVDDAAHEAARNPVTDPADTMAGRVVDDSSPFRDALEVRIYVTAREHLETVDREHEGVTTTARLPPTPNESALAEAKEAVHVDTAENDSALRVTIEDIEITAERDGNTVAESTETVTLTVATPVLTMHDRTVQFEQRLNNRTLDGPGLGRQLTARLYPVAWARGYGQYAGAPIETVVANRHVELSTNAGIVRNQRAAFGQSDPAADRGVTRAGVGTLVEDSLAPTPLDGDDWSSRVIVDPNEPAETTNDPGYLRSDYEDVSGLVDPAPDPEATTTIGVNRSADVALLELLEPGPTNQSTIRKEVYGAEVRYRTAVDRVRTDARPRPSSPGENWTLVDTNRDRTTTVSTADGPTPTVQSDERTFDAFTREVSEQRTIRWTWRNDNRTRTNTAEWTRTYRVGVTLVGRHDPPGLAPDRATRPLFERGGTLNGPNLADVRNEAIGGLESEGRDDLAQSAVQGTLDTGWRQVRGDPPAKLDEWVHADLMELHTEARNVSVTVPLGDVASGSANPPEQLAAEIETRRDDLLELPETYDGAPDRARVAVRSAYLDALVEHLQERADGTAEANAGIETAVRDAGLDGRHEAKDLLEDRTLARNPGCRTAIGPNSPGGSVDLIPEAEPGYLTRTAVDDRHTVTVEPDGEYYPLATRNVNYFTVPYSDVADGIVDRIPLFDRTPETDVSLESAGHVLVTADRALDATDDDSLRRQRSELRREVDASLDHVDERAISVLGEETTLDRGERRDVVERARSKSAGTGRQALAVTDGTFAGTVATTTAARMSDPDPADVDRLETRLRVEIDRTVEKRGQVDWPAANRTATRAQDLARDEAADRIEAEMDDAVEHLGEEWIGDALVTVPAGLPVTPVPAHWYATVNVWSVDVRGTYARFSVRAETGPPTTPGGTLRYVRDGSTVYLDVTGDGEAERLGDNQRVSFETGTTIVVAVPPGPPGVGDVDGTMDDRSPGWPRAGCVEDTRDECLS